MPDRLKQEFELVSDWLSNLGGPSSASWERAVATPIFHLGPIFELATCLAYRSSTGLNKIKLPFETQTTRHLSRAFEVGTSMASNPKIGASGVMSLSECRTTVQAENLVLQFSDAVVQHCKNVGITSRMAQAASGTMEEMANNALSHSGNLRSTVVGFRAQPHLFEFCVVDMGTGILRSLRQNPQLSYLEDDAEALELAIVDGVSRHGNGAAHGNGFRGIFNMPNNHKGYFWLHSGNSALVVDGGEIERPNAHTIQVLLTCGVIASATFQI